jgi:hypothetical protein
MAIAEPRVEVSPQMFRRTAERHPGLLLIVVADNDADLRLFDCGDRDGERRGVDEVGEDGGPCLRGKVVLNALVAAGIDNIDLDVVAWESQATMRAFRENSNLRLVVWTYGT